MTRATIGLVMIDTESYVLANNAMHHCMSKFNFDQVIMFTDRPEYWPNIRTISIPKISSIEEYNQIIFAKMPESIETDFIIVAQFDGFIINPDKFQPQFMDYDYIGALWPTFTTNRVGNGGFSWRSRKLIISAAELAPLRPIGEAEDLFICRRIRSELEIKYKCLFADEQTAQHFSYEAVPFREQSFGFHGIFNMPLIYRDNLTFLVENLPGRVLKNSLNFLRHGGRQLGREKSMELDQLLAARISNSREL